MILATHNVLVFQAFWVKLATTCHIYSTLIFDRKFRIKTEVQGPHTLNKALLRLVALRNKNLVPVTSCYPRWIESLNCLCSILYVSAAQVPDRFLGSLASRSVPSSGSLDSQF